MKPVPKLEITADRTGKVIYGNCVTQDAISWVHEYAPDFGKLHTSEHDKSFTLVVNGCYDVQEVLDYLRSLGEEDSE